MYVFSRIMKRQDKNRIPIKMRFGQSSKFELTKYSYLPAYEKILQTTQAYKHQESKQTKVMVMNNKAYWIQEGGLHTADIVDGILDQNSTKRVDTMAMDDVELKQIIYVIDQLNEGNQYDSRDSGN